MNFKNGKQHGLTEVYHENGQLRNKVNYKDGKEEGSWEYFNEDGSLKKNETWKNGYKLRCEGDCNKLTTQTPPPDSYQHPLTPLNYTTLTWYIKLLHPMYESVRVIKMVNS